MLSTNDRLHFYCIIKTIFSMPLDRKDKKRLSISQKINSVLALNIRLNEYLPKDYLRLIIQFLIDIHLSCFFSRITITYVYISVRSNFVEKNPKYKFVTVYVSFVCRRCHCLFSYLRTILNIHTRLFDKLFLIMVKQQLYEVEIAWKSYIFHEYLIPYITNNGRNRVNYSYKEDINMIILVYFSQKTIIIRMSGYSEAILLFVLFSIIFISPSIFLVLLPTTLDFCIWTSLVF